MTSQLNHHAICTFVLGGGQNECLPRVAALCAALAAIAVLIVAPWHASAHADGGASSARNQTSTSAPSTPNASGASVQAHAQQILRILSDRHANDRVRYRHAHAACRAADRYAPDAAVPLDRVLLTLTASLCARIDARLGVNPAENRTVGLLLNEPAAAPGYTLITGILNNDVFLIDPLGRVAHAWHMNAPFKHAKLLDNGNLLSILGGALEVDPRGNIIWAYKLGGLHHDFLKMPNGNVLLLGRDSKTREQAIAAGANPEFIHEDGLEFDYLIEMRPTGAIGGEVVWEWSVWDHLVQDFDPTKPNYGAIAEHPELIDINFLLETISKRRPIHPNDWLHSNAIDYNPELDQIMLSPRHFGELWIIDRSTTTQEARGHSGGNSGIGGDLLYRWGNPRAYGHGTLADQRLFWQHQTHWIPPGLPGAGNILIFNNGLEFSGDERYYSSVDEIALPAHGYRYRRAENAAYPPDALIWTYVAETPADFYAPITSGAQRLPNGNTLVVDGVAGTIFQATPDGKIVWKYVVPLDDRVHLRQGERPGETRLFPTPYGDPVPLLNNRIYHAYWYPPDYPGLQALDLTPGAYIEDSPDIYDRAYAAGAAALAGAFDAPVARSDFAIYLDAESEYARRLIYIKQPCAADDAPTRFTLHIFPENVRDMPTHRQEHGFENRDFWLGHRGEVSDYLCIATRSLPDYAIERIRTGQLEDGSNLWQADINPDINLYRSLAAAAMAGDFGDPIADSHFDIYLGKDGDVRRLIYIKRRCSADDAQTRFFLHIIPADARDLPAHRRELGFVGFDFNFDGNKVQALDDLCIAVQSLPDYPIRLIRTGQLADGNKLWQADISLNE